MPRDGTETYEKILPAAKEEFLEKGFEQASMREIASRAGISAAGIYRHFKDKEELFARVVQPAIDALMSWYNRYREVDYGFLREERLDEVWNSGADVEMILQVVYPNFDLFKLIICKAEGTRYAHFIHELVEMEQKETLNFMEEAKKRGISVKEIRQEEMHLLMSAYVTALFEVVVHDFPLEDARHYLRTFHEFFYPAWRTVLGF